MKDNRKKNEKIIENQLKSVDTELKDGVFIFTGPMTIQKFAEKIDKKSNEIVAFFFKNGKMFNINHLLDEEQIAELCINFGFDFQKETEITAQNFMEQVEIKEDSKDLTVRPPIITIMGHVDHGKTTLIDNIRNSKIVDSEAGGITQHTGSYQITHNNKKITFLDTPGHEAFTEMRARGAKLTDIVVLVVAADDGVKPQTKEAIIHAKAAKVPIIVFINKMDKPGADVEKVMSELSKVDVVAEKWGGDTQFVQGSGLTGKGIDDLFKAINLQAEMLELKSNTNRYPVGVVVESKVDKGRGVVATIIVENGTLHERDFVVAGSKYGKIRVMTDTTGQKIKEALPGTPVIITGLNYTPHAGDRFFGFSDEKYAKQLANKKAQLDKQTELKERSAINVKDGVKIYNVIVKADVQGTAEAVRHALAKLTTDEVHVHVIAASVGSITKSDILLAQASKAIIFAFAVRPSADMKSLATEQRVLIRPYTVIYKMIEDVEQELKGMQKPQFEEKIIGTALIQKIIFYSKVGNIAGCLMEDGQIKANSLVRLMRDSKVIYEGKLDSLRRGADQVKMVENKKDFGCHIKNFNDIKINDVIEAYEMVEVVK